MKPPSDDEPIEVDGEIRKRIELDDVVIVKERPPRDVDAEMRVWGFDEDGSVRWQRVEANYWVYEEDGSLLQYREFHMGGPAITLRLDPETGQRVDVVASHAIDDLERFLDPPPDGGSTPPYEWGTADA